MERFISLPELYQTDFSILHPVAMAQNWHEKKGFTMTKPRPTHALLLIHACDVTLLRSDGERQSGKRGDVFLLPRGAQYHWIFSNTKPHAPSTFLAEFSLCDSAGCSLITDGPPRRVDGVDGERLLPFFEAAIYALSAPVTGWVRAKAAFYSLLAEISGEGRARRTLDGRAAVIEKSIRYLEEDPTQALSIAEVAALSSVSTNYFEHLFKDYAGFSPMEYRAQKRIERARQLLKDSLLSVGEIAYSLGFEDEAYFCRFFKKKTGITPGAYRKGKKR